MVNVKLIRTTKDNEEALKRIEALLERSDLDDLENDELEILTALVCSFETQCIEFKNLDPIDAIEFRMKELGLNQKDLMPLIGAKSIVSEVMSRKRKLNLRMVRNLHYELNIPLACLIKPYDLKDGTNG